MTRQQRRHQRDHRRRQILGLAAIIACTIFLIIAITEPAAAPEKPAELPPEPTATEQAAPEQPEDPAEERVAICFPMTDEERDLVERVVMAESGAEPFEGQMAVAQCILNACTYETVRPDEAVELYQYADPATEATQSVKDAVAAVFDTGLTVTDEPILFFYAPKYSAGIWHETQTFVLEIGGHRFFKLKGAAS